jgi:hypothetical protein
MSEDLAEGKSTSHKAELEINWEYYGDFVRDVEHKHKLKIENEGDEIKKPGIYKLISRDQSELYVGQGKNLHDRLREYRNAGFNPDNKKEKTNRRIQGWMLRLINENKGPIEIRVCTEALFLSQDGEKLRLDLGGEFNGKYNRELIEHIEIANSSNKFLIQNDPCNWERNKGKC